MKIEIAPEALPDQPAGDRSPYKTYEKVLLNPANTYSHATRPEYVGRVTELIRQCPVDDYSGWRKWYFDRYPRAIEDATDRVVCKLEEFRDVISNIDRETVRRWVTELILEKTYVGLHTERAILNEAAKRLGKPYRASSAGDESKGIDGYIGDQPVSVKPTSYKNDQSRLEKIEAPIIWYETEKLGGLVADLSAILNS